MKRVAIVAGVLASLAVILPVSQALAAPFDNNPKILLHVRGTTTKNACTTWGTLADCQTAVTKGDLTATVPAYFVYLLAAKGSLPSLAGLQCGIEYQGSEKTDDANNDTDQIGVDVFGWTLCATLEFITPAGTPVGNPGRWPEPHGGNLITWDSANKCQTGEVGVAGYFYLGAYSADTFALTVRPVDNAVKVADCSNSETAMVASDLGIVSFSSGASTDGCNPCLQACGGVPVEATTWGKVKALY